VLSGEIPPRGAVTIAVVIAVAALAACDRPDRRAAPAPDRLRVVTLTPSATELVHALGATGQLVAVDDYSTFPAGSRPCPGSAPSWRPTSR
jgi:ABC-type hemin transport system substrate-binding protein